MKDQTIRSIAISAMCLLLAVTVVGQSTNPSSPTPVNGQYTGKGPSKETNYYFSFTAGPGAVSVKLDIKAKDYSTFARIEIGNDPSNLIAMANMNASTTTGPASVAKDFTLDKKRTVRVKLTLDGNLAEYRLSINGGGDGGFADDQAGESGGNTSNTTGSSGASGKFATSSASKIGSLGSSGGKQKTGTQNSNSGSNAKLSFQCPSEVTYKIVPPGNWKPGLFGQLRFLFQQANVVSPVLSCTYQSLTGQESVTLLQNIPAGYTCEVWNGGKKTREIICTAGATALVTPRIEMDKAGM